MTCGDLNVQKHYLPRTLEIAVTEGFDYPDLELVFERLNDGPELHSARWVDWPASQRIALRAFFEAFWIDQLATVSEDDGVIDDALCAIGVVDPDVEWYLAEWLRFGPEPAADHLLRFLRLNAEDLAHGALWNAYWDTRPPADVNQAKIISWTRSHATREAIAAAAEHARTPAEADRLTACLRLMT